MDFEKFEFAQVGRDADDGVTVEDDLNDRIREIARMVVDDSYGDEGAVTLQLKVKKAASSVVTVEAKVKASVPARKKKALVGHVTGKGELVAEKAVQQNFPYDPQKVVDMARAENGQREE